MTSKHYSATSAAIVAAVLTCLLASSALAHTAQASLSPADKTLSQVSYAAASVSQSAGCSSSTSFAIGRVTTMTVATPTGLRNFMLYVPKSYQRRRLSSSAGALKNRAVPLLLLFHGLGDNCVNFIKATRFMSYAETYGYIVASLCGTSGLLGTGWNAGTCCGFTSDEPDDVAFAHQVRTFITQRLCVDERKVAAVGFSNGAMLAEVLACHSPDVFRAVASVSGVTEIRPGQIMGLVKCDQLVQQVRTSRRPSVLIVHGDRDPIVPWGGNAVLGFPSVPLNGEAWVQRNGCTSQTQTTINSSYYQNTIYPNCAAPNINMLQTSEGATAARAASAGLAARHNKTSAAVRADGAADAPAGALAQTTAAMGDWNSIVEVVRAFKGGHNWFNANGFSATDYIAQFLQRVFVTDA